MDKKDCNHCWHPHTGPLMMVIKEGHVVQSCCKCQDMRQVHRGHSYPSLNPSKLPGSFRGWW